ncbi:glutathione S-transferase family protein [Pseudogulbenkiania subflava]|uniref:Glutathione S-transferase n=1 Tax=Pseudogulbenkiania subflava DSM 22618 TaxID=1123014 RepID=A0A1Y6BZQ9_9NEIS|nr:glutathione S-transferase family protein [Pseudogulbenkiania subflava]SMF38278.1 glutathione S-transferase [Pseudogulbenkiania subflava DSM 22618]
MKLYYHPASTTSRIIMMFAAEEAIPLDYQLVDLMTGEHLKPEFQAINPSCLVPVLDDDGFVLAESGAIIRYLAGMVQSMAYPSDLKKRARVDEAMEWFYSNYYKDHGYGLVYPQLFPHHKRPTEEAHAGTIAWGKQRAQHWLGILDKNLIGPDRPFLCGDTITLADYVGAEMVAVGELVRCEYLNYPNVRRWLGRMKALPSWGKVHEVVEGFKASLKDQPFVSI